jgi:hypothetical protein
MLGSITPLGERGRKQRWGITASAYVLGSSFGGAALGAALGWSGGRILTLAGLDRSGLDRSVSMWGLAVAIAVAAALDLRLPGLRLRRDRLPGPRRQVNEDWLTRYRGWVYGLAFGAQLGTGVVTVVSTGAVYATFAAAFLTGSTAAGAAVGASFGVVRGASVLAGAGVDSIDRLLRMDGRIQEWNAPARRLTVAVQAALVLSTVLVALG